jgi:hypothetical protein
MAYEMKYINVPIGGAIPPNTEYLDLHTGKWRRFYPETGAILQTNWVIPPERLRVSELKGWDE